MTVPSGITAEATGADGATVTFEVQAQASDGTPNISCDRSSGDVFPIGQTTVTCTATDPSDGSSVSQSFVVTVQDTTPPDFSPTPADVTKEVDGGAFGQVEYA